MNMRFPCLPCLLLTGSLLFASDDDGPLARSVYSLDAEAAIAHTGIPPGFPARLAEKRREILMYTLDNLHKPLGRFEWAIPVVALHHWSQLYESRTFEQSGADVRDLYVLLRTAPDRNLPYAAHALAGIISGYGQRWLNSPHAPEALALVDEIRDWLIRTPEGERQWNLLNGFTVVQALINEGYFPAGKRQWLRESRWKMLLQMLADPDLPIRRKHSYVSFWANALYNNGDGEEAHAVMQSWWRHHEANIADQHFLCVWMKILLYDRRDMKAAGHLLEYLNQFDGDDMRQAQRQHKQQSAEYYYNAIQLPEYEIGRLRNMDIRKNHETREQARAMLLEINGKGMNP